MATCCSYSNPSRNTSLTCVVWSRWPRSINCYRQSCSPSTETSTRAVKSTCCSPCSRSVQTNLPHTTNQLADLFTLQSVLTYQFDNTPDYSSLLRANTPVSRMMTTYTRRGPGQGYLKTVLSEQINYVTSKLRDVDLEINPLKVYETMMAERASIRGSTSSLPPGGITAEEAAANPQVQAIISRRVGQLIQLANYFLDTIVNNLDETPYGIRWICKQIRSLSRRKYPDAHDQTICTLIGGFFFLRFINPAIVTPRSYMLIEQNPAENPKRTLTLVRR